MSFDCRDFLGRCGATILLALLFGAAPAAAQTLSLTNATYGEGDSGTVLVTIQVELSTPSANAVSVRVATANGNATAGSDYVAVDTVITIPAGAIRKAVNFTINSDTLSEPDEEFYVNLSNAVNATIADSQGVVTIVSDDTSLAVNDVTLIEGNSLSQYFEFKVSLSNRSSKTVTFDYATVEGTATGIGVGADFYAQSGQNYAFFPGETEKLFRVSVRGDSVVEGDETFQLKVSNVGNATVVDGAGLGTIINDDAGSATVSVNSVTLAEGASGTTSANFTVQLSTPQQSAVSFNITTANGSATAGSDYVAKSQTGMQIAAGATSQSFSVLVNGDSAYENDETFSVKLSNPVGVVLGYGTGAGNILNDDPIPLAISIDDTQFGEGSNGSNSVPVVVKLSTAAAVDVLFNIATSNGTAIAGSDYDAFSLTDQVIPAGVTSKIIYVVVNGDKIDENDETFRVQLSNVRNAPTPTGFATFTIWDDDVANPVPSISIGDVSVTEGNSSSKLATFTVQLSEPSASPVGFSIATANATATAGSDYVALSLAGQSIAAGQTSKTFSVTINGDTSVEPDELFQVVLSNLSGATMGDDAAWGTIVNDDATSLPAITIQDSQLTETDVGNGTMSFYIHLSQTPVQPVTFDLQVVDGSAVAGVDYIGPTSPVTIPAGSDGISIGVTVIGDNLVEGNETFNVKLQNVAGATVADGEAIGTIYNDDQAQGDGPVMRLEDAYVTEGQSGTKNAAVTVRLSSPSTSQVWFSYQLVDGTAVLGSDYQSPADQQVWIAPGVTVQTFNIPIIGDTVAEPNETFVVKLFSSQGAYRGDEDAVVTIVNDEGGAVAPMLSIVDAFSVNEGNSGTQSVIFDVTLSEASASPVTFNIATANGAATAGSDFVAKSSALTIPAGTKSASFAVTVNGDTSVEGDEHFLVNLTNAVGATVMDAQAIGMIANDDNAVGAPILSVANVSISEGNAGTKQLAVMVSLSAPAAGAVTYNIATSDGSAMAGSDYVASSLLGQSIPAGATSKAFNVTINGDSLGETDEFFRVNLSNVSGAALGTNEAEATILNDDGGVPTLSVDDVSIAEGNSGSKLATFTVTLSVPQPGPVSFDIATADLTAQAGSDYVAKALAGVSLAAGATSSTFTVTINGDTTYESSELFFVNLSNAVGATIGDGQGAGSINNDDASVTPVVSIGDVSVTEGDSGTKLATFTVSLSTAGSSDVTYSIGTANGSADSVNDFVATSLSYDVIPVGQTSKTFSVTINGDTEVEGDETFLVAVTNVFGATVGDSSATGTITNDDGGSTAPTLSIADVSIAEGNSGTKIATFTVKLSAARSSPVFFDIATANGTATSGSDYVAKSTAAVRMAAGSTSKTFTVTINGDTASEPDESFLVNLSNPAGATLADNQAVGTITNDDASGTPTISIADASISEGDSGTKLLSFPVTLSAAATSQVAFTYATVDGSAIAGSFSDYLSATSTVVFDPGQTSKTVSISINGDTSVEPDEFFLVNVSVISGNALVADGSAIGTITNDDAGGLPSLSIADVSISEGNSGSKTATFTVSLSGPSAGVVNFDIATANGSATAGSDYVALSMANQAILTGLTSRTFEVTINGDTTVEPNETFTVTLSNVNGATLGDGSAIGTITNDDSAGGTPTISIGDVTTTEGNSLTKQVTFTVTLSAAASAPVTYNIATANGTAVAGTDYVAKSMTGQSILAGATSKSFTVSIKGDTLVEPNETFMVNLSSVVGATIADGQGIGTISNDDVAGISVARFDALDLVDDIDSGNRAPLLSGDEYALLLLDTATKLCARTGAATVVGIDGVENRTVLADLADATSVACATAPRYTAVMAEGERRGFLVAPEIQVNGAPDVLTTAHATILRVQGVDDAGPTQIVLAGAPAGTLREQTEQASALAHHLAQVEGGPLVLLGAREARGLVDLSLQGRPASTAATSLPAEHILVNMALLREYTRARVDFPALPANEAPVQVLQLQR